MVLGGFIMVTKQLHGLVLNLYVGAIGATFTLYAIFGPSHGDHVFRFVKWFLSLYSSAIYLALCFWALKEETPPEGFQKPEATSRDRWLEGFQKPETTSRDRW